MKSATHGLDGLQAGYVLAVAHEVQGLHAAGAIDHHLDRDGIRVDTGLLVGTKWSGKADDQ